MNPQQQDHPLSEQEQRYLQQMRTTTLTTNQNVNALFPSTVRETDSLNNDDSFALQNNLFNDDDDSVNTVTNLTLQQQFLRNQLQYQQQQQQLTTATQPQNQTYQMLTTGGQRNPGILGMGSNQQNLNINEEEQQLQQYYDQENNSTESLNQRASLPHGIQENYHFQLNQEEDEEGYEKNQQQLQQQQQQPPLFMHMNSGNGTINGNNYDFLIDEEYQQVKALQGVLTNSKWQVIGEKVALHLILKDVLSDLLSQRDLLQSTKQQPPTTITDPNSAQKFQKYGSMAQTANSSLKTNQNPQFSLSTTQYKQYQQYQQLQQKQNYTRNPRYMSLREIDLEMKSVLGANNLKINKILDKQGRLKTLLAQEQEKSQFLEQQLNQRLKRQSVNESTENQREQYITELETQLQETRKMLLDKKLQVSDKDQEVQSLKRQLQSTDESMKKLEEQKREIDELVIKVSQELKAKEYDLRDFNYQMANDRDHLARQVDLLKRELQEERDRKQALELLESDLIYKCQQKDQEIDNLKGVNLELQEKVSFNGESIEKAQRVIERLNEELEMGGKLLKEIERERDQFRAEARDQGKRILDLNKQLQATQAQHQIAQQQMNIHLRKEIDELKEALHQYQQQFDEERRNLNLNLREANDDKYKLHIDKEKSEIALTREITSLKQQLEEAKQKHQKQLNDFKKEHQDQLEMLQMQSKSKDESAESQIRYMQKRLKEMSNDIVNNQNYQMRVSSQNPAGQNSTQSQPTGKLSYLAVLKQEFTTLSEELLATRTIVKSHSTDLSAVSLPSKLEQFEQFRIKVLRAIEEWEIKSDGLAKLSERYEKELDDYKKIFTQMKQMLRDKDQLIQQVQKQVRLRDQQKDNYVRTMQKELERQTYIIKQDLIEQFKVTQQSAEKVNVENQDLDRRFQSFKYEYMQVLEDRDRTNNQNLLLKGQVEVMNRDLDMITAKHYQLVDKVRVIVNKSHTVKQDAQILDDVESVVDELKVRNDEVVSYKSQLQTLQAQYEEDKKYLNQKLQAVEEQLQGISRSNIMKEEEMQQAHHSKESKLVNDLQRVQSENANMYSQLQTRERQVKKLQEQKGQMEEEINQLALKLDKTINEKFNMELECQRTVELIGQVQASLERTQSELEEKEYQISEVSQSKLKLEEKLADYKEQLYSKELELQRETDLNLQLQDEKYQAISVKDGALDKQSAFERENQSLYKELQGQKEAYREISRAFEDTEREKIELQRTCEQMNEVVGQVQEEIMQSQRAIEGLNQALEKMKRKYNKAKELKHQVKAFKSNEAHQNELLEVMRRQLNKPRANAEIQTYDSGILQLQYLSEESQHLQQRLLLIQRENDQLQDSVKRQNLDINRLIDEKRDLEDLVDQQNQSIKQIRLNNQQQALSQSLNNGQVSKENVNSLNNSVNNKYSGDGNQDLYVKILQEKENYIMRLEQELSDMRREMEGLKEKLISYEIGNLSMDRSIGGQILSGGGHIRSYQPPLKHSSITSTTLPTNLQSQGVIRGVGNYSKNHHNNRLNMTQNSLHFSNMYHNTQGTNSNINAGNNTLALSMLAANANNNQFSTLPAGAYMEEGARSSLNRSNIL